jgi:hypothetical protein
VLIAALMGCHELPIGKDGTAPATPEEERDLNLASSAGDHALDFLRADPYDRLQIEIDYVTGHPPDPDALDHLVDVLGRVADKPGGVEVLVDDELPDQGAPAWTVEDAQALEVEWRDGYRDEATGTAVLYYLYLDGHSAEDDDQGRILGFAYHGSSLVMFAETMADVSGGLPLLSEGGVEESVIAHELGHVLGLVNNGVGMQQPHQDAPHGAHCDDEGCLMYWAVETDLIGDLLGQGVPDFDARCLADLEAARE